MLLLFYIIPEWDWCFTYWIYIRVLRTFVAYTNITESSKNITCQGSKSYQDYPLKLRTKGQNKWTKEFFLLFLAWLTFIAFKHALASFSLERRWCSALIGGSRTAPCVAEKTNSGMTWQSLPRSEQMWSVQLIYLPGFGPSSCVSLFQPVRQVYFQTRKGLAALPASKLNALKPRFPIRWYQWPRPSGLSCRHLHSH